MKSDCKGIFNSTNTNKDGGVVPKILSDYKKDDWFIIYV